jgi:hypothetical protein
MSLAEQGSHPVTRLVPYQIVRRICRYFEGKIRQRESQGRMLMIILCKRHVLKYLLRALWHNRHVKKHQSAPSNTVVV